MSSLNIEYQNFNLRSSVYLLINDNVSLPLKDLKKKTKSRTFFSELEFGNAVRSPKGIMNVKCIDFKSVPECSLGDKVRNYHKFLEK